MFRNINSALSRSPFFLLAAIVSTPLTELLTRHWSARTEWQSMGNLDHKAIGLAAYAYRLRRRDGSASPVEKAKSLLAEAQALVALFGGLGAYNATIAARDCAIAEGISLPSDARACRRILEPRRVVLANAAVIVRAARRWRKRGPTNEEALYVLRVHHRKSRKGRARPPQDISEALDRALHVDKKTSRPMLSVANDGKSRKKIEVPISELSCRVGRYADDAQSLRDALLSMLCAHIAHHGTSVRDIRSVVDEVMSVLARHNTAGS